jgi:hypothetical protein
VHNALHRQERDQPTLGQGREPSASSGAVVEHAVVLLAVGAHLVSPLAGADLSFAVSRMQVVGTFLPGLGYTFFQGDHRGSSVLVLALGGRFGLQASGSVGGHDATLGLVSVLAAGSAVLGEAQLHVGGIELGQRGAVALKDRHCHGRGEYSAFSLGRWNALPPVAAALEQQRGQRLFGALELQMQSARRVSAHGCARADAGGVRLVDGRLVRHQELGVLTAFCGPDFNEELHGISRWVAEMCDCR